MNINSFDINHSATNAFAPSEGTPLVSIIMPLYNAEKYVAEAIESVQAQTYTHWELIIVNDGSTDGSLAVASQYESEKIKVYSQENKGASAARNFGYNQSKGKYIKFFDADDIISANMLEAQVALVEQNKVSIVVSSWGRFYNNDISTFKLTNSNNIETEPINWIINEWRYAQPMTQPGMFLIQRKTIEDAGLWNEKLSLIDDFEFYTRVILNSKKIELSKEAILLYRSGLQNALSGQKSRKAVESAFLSLDLSTNTLLQYNNSPISKLSCANIWQGFVYEFYYQQQDLAIKAEQKIKELGGSDFYYPCGNYTKILVKIFGWKKAKKIRQII